MVEVHEFTIRNHRQEYKFSHKAKPLCLGVNAKNEPTITFIEFVDEGSVGCLYETYSVLKGANDAYVPLTAAYLGTYINNCGDKIFIMVN